jgi:carbon-monoxide dehydrogenase large subunit
MSTRLFGQSVPRLEDEAILRGTVSYLDDVPFANGLHVAIVRSPLAHAGITGIGRSDDAPDGDVITAASLGEWNGPQRHPTWFPASDHFAAALDGFVLREETLEVLASTTVRYVGEPVAAVLADDPYRANDAAEGIVVDYGELPVLADAAAGLQPGAHRLHPEWPDNVAAHFTVANGDVEAGLRAADVVVRATLGFGRQTGTPIEPRGVVAVPNADPGFDLTVWSSTQAPLWLRAALARFTGLAPERIRVVAPAVGGGFGIKSMVYREELLIPMVALRTGRPVKWVETRSEHFLTAVQSRDQRHEVELGLTRAGDIIALRDHYVVDVGASNVEGLVVPYNTAAHLQGAYRIPAVEIDCTCALSNKAPLSAYRGAGRPEAVFAMERALDLAAAELGIDPVELRRRNLLRTDEVPYDAGIPYRTGDRLVLDIGDVRETLEVAVRAADYAGWRERQEQLRAEGRRIGIGVATYVEGTGIGPAERARVSLTADGRAEVVVALPSQGQGHATTLAQICADELGLELADVRVVQGDTAAMDTGGGTIASRTAVVVGNAVAQASRELREVLVQSAGDRLEASPEDLELTGGRVQVVGAPGVAVRLGELVAGAPTAFSVDSAWGPDLVTFACGTHLAVVEVQPRTGAVEILRYVVAHDCGRVINPLIVDGQVAGGVAQGIGGALLEELRYDEQAQLVTGSFMDYLIPRASMIPRIEVHHVETPSARNPMGIRGVGEAGAIGPPAAIAGAVEDALRDLGAQVTYCPLTPDRVAALAGYS